MRDGTCVVCFEGAQYLEGLRQDVDDAIGCAEEEVLRARADAAYVPLQGSYGILVSISYTCVCVMCM